MLDFVCLEMFYFGPEATDGGTTTSDDRGPSLNFQLK